MHKKDLRTAGVELSAAQKVVVMLHGRGAPADDILGLGAHLDVEGFALIAPQATRFTWYPLSFLAPTAQNEPWLSSAIEVLASVIDDINKAGIPDEQIYFTGFSQGACLTLEFTTRYARKWGGIAAFTGGLIGERVEPERYKGDFAGTRVYIGSSDPDAHVPTDRVNETANLLTTLGADVKLSIFPDMGHTITGEEIAESNAWVFRQ